jgi:signal transduction histidine kinase
VTSRISVRRTLVVDDHEDLRLLLRLVLERSGRFEVVAEAADGRAALELAELHDPDLILLDLSMPRMDGLEALPALRRIVPDARLVVLSGYAAAGAAGPAARAGADAYLEKGMSPEEMLRAIDDAARRPDDAPPPTPERWARPDPSPTSAAEIVARLAHDVRSPLVTAAGAIDVLQSVLPTDSDPEVRELVRRAVASLERVERTLGSTIEHARSGQSPLDPRELPLGPLLHELLDTIPDAPGRVEVRGDPTLRAFADATALQRVLTNLLENALRYSTGPVDVRLRSDGTAAVVEVRDRGPGLGPEADDLFRPFVRGAAATGQPGSGLGLATAAELVRRMRGELRAQDHPSGGAVFTVAVPLG